MPAIPPDLTGLFEALLVKSQRFFYNKWLPNWQVSCCKKIVWKPQSLSILNVMNL
jgi:hypothetical protein